MKPWSKGSCTKNCRHKAATTTPLVTSKPDASFQPNLTEQLRYGSSYKFSENRWSRKEKRLCTLPSSTMSYSVSSQLVRCQRTRKRRKRRQWRMETPHLELGSFSISNSTKHKIRRIKKQASLVSQYMAGRKGGGRGGDTEETGRKDTHQNLL